MACLMKLLESSSASGSGSSVDVKGFFTDLIDSIMELMAAAWQLFGQWKLFLFKKKYLCNLWGEPLSLRPLSEPRPRLPVHAMAAELEKVQGTIAECSEQTRSGLKSVSETLDTAEEQLASLRKTIEALDSFESRWKVSMN